MPGTGAAPTEPRDGRFGAVLRRVGADLALPQPARARILEEMAADLEDLYRVYRARGLGEEEALRRAERALGASPEAVAALVRLHRPLYQRLLDRFSADARGRVERMALTLVSLAGVATAAGALLHHAPLSDPSPFVWPLLLLAAAAAATTLAVLFRLFVKQDHAPARLRDGLVPLLALSAAAALVGVFGALFEVYATAADVARSGSGSPEILLPRLRRGAEVAALGLAFTLAALLAWFHLRQRVLAIERAEAALPGR